MKTRQSRNKAKSSSLLKSKNAVESKTYEETDVNFTTTSANLSRLEVSFTTSDIRVRRQNRSHKLRTKPVNQLEKCVICSVQVPIKSQNSEKRSKRKKTSDKEKHNRIQFVFKECLELCEEQFHSLNLLTLTFCDEDVETVERGLEMHYQIKELTLRLDKIKRDLRDVLIQSLLKNDPEIEVLGVETGPVFQDSSATNITPSCYEQIRQVAKRCLDTSNFMMEAESANLGPNVNEESIKADAFIESELGLLTDEIKVEIENVDFDFCEIDPLSDDDDDDFITDDAGNTSPTRSTPDSIAEDDSKNIQEESDPEFELKEFISDVTTDSDEEKIVAKTSKKRTRHSRKRQSASQSQSNITNQSKPKRSRTKAKRDSGEKSFRTSRAIGRTKKFQCSVCNKAFLTKEERTTHRDAEHGPGNRFDCKICPCEYLNVFDLRSHISRAHTSERPFLCDKCPYKYATSGDLKKHIFRRHSVTATEMLPCPICDKQFKGKFNLKAHVKVFHELGGAPRKHLVCEFCGKVYSNSDAFKEHKAKIHLSTFEPSICDLCGKHLSDSRSLKKHKLSQHLKTFKHKCHICGTGCLYKSHLDAHMKLSHALLPSDNCNSEVSSKINEPLPIEQIPNLNQNYVSEEDNYP